MSLDLYQVIVELQQLTDPKLMKDKISQYNEELNEFLDSLMVLEFQLVNKLEVAHRVILLKLLRTMCINT